MKLEFAKNKLIDSDYTCVLYDGNEVLTSKERGVKPLLEMLDSGRDFSGFVAADRVIGKAAAYLYVLLGIKEVYALVVSKHALDVFEKYSVWNYCEECVPSIINRAGTGLCPMESAVLDAQDPQEALERIKEKLKTL